MRPNFIPQAQTAILKVLQPGTTMSTQDLYKAAVQITVRLPQVVVPEPVVPPTSQPKKQPPPPPPTPDDAIRSISHLKKVILPSLEAARVVRKVHTRRELTPVELEARLGALNKAARKAKASSLEGTAVHEWLWERYPEEKLEAQKEAARLARSAEERKAREAETPFGWEVGVGKDFSHLNKRRQRSREESVGRDVKWLEKLKRVRTVATPPTA